MSSIWEASDNGGADLPPEIQQIIASAPRKVDRRTGAELVTRYLFPVSHRSLEMWPLPVRHVNGKAIISTAALFEVAYSKLSSAPVVRRGKSSHQLEAR